MKNSIQIAVPKPCDEKWNSFTQTSNGGFCASCQKEVIDFTSWSDDRLKLYFKNLPGNTCGRFRASQLKVYASDTRASTPFGWLSVLFAGILLLFSSRLVVAQRNPSKQPTEQYQGEIKIGQVSSTVLSVVKVSGVVKSSEDWQVMPGVTVVCKGTEQRTVTDTDGRFELTLENLPSSPVVVFSFIGFQSVEFPVDVMKEEQQMAVNMPYDRVELTGDVIVGGALAWRWYSPRGLWWRIRGIFR